MGIRPFFKFVPGDKVVIAAFIASAMAHRAVEQHFTAAAGRLGNGDIKAAVLPHSDQVAISRYTNAAGVAANGHIVKPEVSCEGAQENLSHIEEDLLAPVGATLLFPRILQRLKLSSAASRRILFVCDFIDMAIPPIIDIKEGKEQIQFLAFLSHGSCRALHILFGLR